MLIVWLGTTGRLLQAAGSRPGYVSCFRQAWVSFHVGSVQGAGRLATKWLPSMLQPHKCLFPAAQEPGCPWGRLACQLIQQTLPGSVSTQNTHEVLCSPGVAHAACTVQPPGTPGIVSNPLDPPPHRHPTRTNLNQSKASPGLIGEGQSSSHGLPKQALPRSQAGLNLGQGVLGHDVHHVQGRVHQPGQAHGPPRALPLCNTAGTRPAACSLC